MPHDPERLLVLAAELQKPFERYLKWKIIVDRYERGKSSKVASAILALKKEEKESYASLEARALGSEEFVSYLAEWHEAEKQMVRARIEYDTKKCEFDALTSVLAYERESMKRLGG